MRLVALKMVALSSSVVVSGTGGLFALVLEDRTLPLARVLILGGGSTLTMRSGSGSDDGSSWSRSSSSSSSSSSAVNISTSGTSIAARREVI